MVYPEKHDCRQEDRWLGSCEDEVARHLKDDILMFRAHVSLCPGNCLELRQSLRRTHGDEEDYQSDRVLIRVHAQVVSHASNFGVADVSSLCRQSAE
jgi:hypothetical protein